jgi:hypothetical protein
MAGALSIVVMSGLAVVLEWPSVGTVRVRVENSSDADFDEFRIEFVRQMESYGPLAAGAVSEYRVVEATYGYAYTEARSGARKFVLQPIDFMGEQLLSPGAYTFKYTVHGDHLDFQFIVDSENGD